MAKKEVEILGLENLARKLRALQELAGAILEASAEAGAQLLAEEMQSREPGADVKYELAYKKERKIRYHIGPTKEKWFYRFRELGAQSHEITGKPMLVWEQEGVSHASGRVENPGMAAKPFMRPTFDGRKADAVKLIAGMIKERVEGVANGS